ncbi:centrosomal protein of 78 kDa-like isoform X2 [Stigmatopora argus]
MGQESVEMRRLGADNFTEYYNYACTQQGSTPLTVVKMHVDKGLLEFNGDRAKFADWAPILDSISINKHLQHIAIVSTFQTGHGCGDADRKYYKPVFRKKPPSIRSKDVTFKLCKALKECLSISPNLKTLKLDGLLLRNRDLVLLTKGVANALSLEALSLANCPIGDEGLEVICQSVKYSTRIKEVDLTGCNITWRGADHLANIIQHQGIQRHGTAWAQSLRYQRPKFEGMGGLRRLTLNANSLIGDLGAARLGRQLAEDHWIKAVDLQKCGISNRGARCLLEVLKTNSTLCVLDVRNNPLVDHALMKTIIEKVLTSAASQAPEYSWLAPAAREPPRGAKRRVASRAERAESGERRGTSVVQEQRSLSAPVGRAASPRRHVPHHSAARAGRQRGFPPADASRRASSPVGPRHLGGQAASASKVSSASASEDGDVRGGGTAVAGHQNGVPGESDADRRLERMQVALQECRLRLREERRARLRAESFLRELELENARLRDGHPPWPRHRGDGALDDEDVLDSIERSFGKFHAFLDLVKDAGLGQLASVAGIDASDFPPPVAVGRPQLSSTLGHRRRAEEASRDDDDAVAPQNWAGARPDDTPAYGRRVKATTTPPPRREGAPDAEAVGPTDLSAIREEESDQFFEPETQYDSGSERSFSPAAGDGGGERSAPSSDGGWPNLWRGSQTGWTETLPRYPAAGGFLEQKSGRR